MAFVSLGISGMPSVFMPKIRVFFKKEKGGCRNEGSLICETDL